MWIVRLALSQPHTFIVMAVSILLFGLVSLSQMPVDIFPPIDIPIVSCVWTYTGMSPKNVENLITTVSERSLASTVSGIQHLESMSLNGMSVIKIYLHKGSDIGLAVAQAASTSSATLRQMPPNMSPPLVVQSSATDVPILQLSVASKELGEAQLFDLANQFIRSQLAVVQGTTIPFPSGGKYRQVVVDLDEKALFGYGLTPTDVVNAVNNSSVIAPSGTAKMGKSEFVITLNNSPKVIEQLNDIPVKHQNNTTVFVKDVAFVHDGFQPQLNIVNINGHRGVIMNILKSGGASTLAVVKKVKEVLPHIRTMLPSSASLEILTDQSKFVQECVDDVAFEVVNAAVLTALFMLAILGSWRSTLIVITSIPLAILSAIICLHVTGNTINSMTLGGLALAVGMLVDDATVEIENVHRQMEMGKHVEQAILDGAAEVALPAMVSTVSICIVFLPVFLLSEPSRSLFVPLGMTVCFAMLASYGLSRTIVPLMSKALFKSEEHVPAEGSKGGAEHGAANAAEKAAGVESEASDAYAAAGAHAEGGAHGAAGEESNRKPPGIFGKIHLWIDGNFNRARDTYHQGLIWALDHRPIVAGLFLGFYALSSLLVPSIGRDFFPPIDAGQIRLHVNVPSGTRVEETAQIYSRIERKISEIIPKEEIKIMTDNIGLPVSGINFAFSDSQTISEADGEILVSLEEHRSHPTDYYQVKIRNMLNTEFPECAHYYQPADIVTQILNAGLPAPIDIKIIGLNAKENYQLALDIKRDVKKVRGAVDVCLHQVVNAPEYLFSVDRTFANQVGLTQKDVSNSMLVNLSSSFQVMPNFWTNVLTGVQYNLAAQAPQRTMRSLNDLANMSVGSASTQENQNQPVQLMNNLAKPKRQYTPYVVNHINVQPCYDIYADTEQRDLGGVSDDIQKIVDKYKTHLPRGTLIKVMGQVLSMQTAFLGLLVGLVGAVILVYLLLVVNFQSWLDPLTILMAIPGALTGIVWSLFVTQTTFSVPALMGAVMTIGVASANSILMVTFCNEQLREGLTPLQAASMAGLQRFRPVCMTAIAMVLGMIPMSLGTGQNAAIGRAVIGGLTVATFSTLFFVPLMYSVLKRPKEPVMPPHSIPAAETVEK
ncbi:MAG: efflux RND transporter permease subunit [Cyanobacteria bacterium SZAS LIN-5]|nr:efflux RND transporter permease subunit [Cyanobacteria bacterium SZAS LIN-5]